MASIPSFTPKTPKTRVYSDFRGVDFTSDSTRVSLYRSPNCVNMYKDYKSSLGQAIETRPGFVNLLELESEIYGIHFIKKDSLKLTGYSNMDGSIINKLDKDYESSKVIKGLKLKKDGNFYSTSKVLSNEKMDEIYHKVD